MMDAVAWEILRALRTRDGALPPAERDRALVVAAEGPETDAVLALTRLCGRSDDEAWPVLARIAQAASRQSAVREAALRVLAGWPDTLRLLAALQPLLEDADPAVRRAVVAALPAAPEADSLLQQLEFDPDPEVQRAVRHKRRIAAILEPDRRHPHDLLADALRVLGARLVVDDLGLWPCLDHGEAARVAEDLYHQTLRRRFDIVEPATLGAGTETLHETEAELLVPPRFRLGENLEGAKLTVQVGNLDGTLGSFEVTADGTAVTGRVQVPWGMGRASHDSFRGGLALVFWNKRPDLVLAWGTLGSDEGKGLVASCHCPLPAGTVWAGVMRRSLRSIPGTDLQVLLVHPSYRPGD